MNYSDEAIAAGSYDGRRAVYDIISRHVAVSDARRATPGDADWLTVAAAAAEEFQVTVSAVYTGRRRQDARARGAAILFSCCFWQLGRDDVRARAFGMVRSSIGPARFEAEPRWVRDVSALAERACLALAELHS